MAKDAWFPMKAREAGIGKNGGTVVWKSIRDIQHRCRKMFSLMGAGQNVPGAKAVCRQIKCPHRANVMGAAAPIAPMVSTPMYNVGDGAQSQ